MVSTPESHTGITKVSLCTWMRLLRRIFPCSFQINLSLSLFVPRSPQEQKTDCPSHAVTSAPCSTHSPCVYSSGSRPCVDSWEWDEEDVESPCHRVLYLRRGNFRRQLFLVPCTRGMLSCVKECRAFLQQLHTGRTFVALRMLDKCKAMQNVLNC